MMRTLSPELIKTLVTHFSFGAVSHFDPAVATGSQRESWHDLGFGWIYWALARVTEPLKVLVVGSGRGFSAACLGLGIEQRPKADVLLVDPGYRLWAVENTQDAAEGYWESEQQATQHFARHLDLSNIKLLRMRSDEAFHHLHNEGQRFDLVMIDGEHSYSQAMADLRNAAQCLNAGGIILAHDTVCPQWPGVALAIEAFTLESPGLECLSLPLFPGLSLIKRRERLIQVRPVTPHENTQINSWRVEVGVAARPLPDGDDPQPGIKRADAREGLFGIFEKDQLIGGFGIRHRNFDGMGSDNFMPYGSQMLDGHLVYGLVLKPESRGQRRWQLAMCEILRWFPDDGLYFITQHPQRGREVPYVIEGVGHAAPCMAFRYRFPKTCAITPRVRNLLEHSWRSLEELAPRQELATKELELVKQTHHAAELQEMLNEISRELEHLAARKIELEQQVIAMRGEHGQTERTLEAVIYSTSWRWTHPARLLGVQARTGWRKLKSFVRWPSRPSNP